MKFTFIKLNFKVNSIFLPKFLFLFIIILLNLLLSGCSGCTYFFVKIENLDSTMASSQENSNDQNGENNSDSNQNGNPMNTLLPSATPLPTLSLPYVLEVKPLFPTHGVNWNDYIKYDNSKTVINQTEQSCNTTTSSSFTFPTQLCLHGGEFKKVVIPDQSSCSGFELTDNQNVFRWYCSDSTNPIFFYSKGFQENKFLSHLITNGSFTPLKVILKHNNLFWGESDITMPWWSNPIEEVTLNSTSGGSVLTLNTNGKIYTLSTSGSSAGVEVNGHGVSFVVMPTATLTPTATVSLHCGDDAVTSKTCLVGLNGNRIWLEGHFKSGAGLGVGTGSIVGIVSTLSRSLPFAHTYTSIQFKNVKVTGVGINSRCIDFQGTQASKLENLDLSNCHTGLYTERISGSYFRKIKTYNNIAYGAWFDNTGFDGNFIHQLHSHNNGDTGIVAYGHDDYYSQIISTNNGNSGIECPGGDCYLSINQLLSSNNSNYGVKNYGGFGGNLSLILNSTFVNNTNGGLYLEDGAIINSISINNTKGIILKGTYAQLTKNVFVANNSTTGLDLSGDNVIWEGKLLLNNTTNCSYTSVGSNIGVSGANCTIQAPNTATTSLGVDYSNLFTGATLSDSANGSGGVSMLSELITDWFNFENILRSWVKNSGVGRCTAGNTCDIYDFNLKPTNIDLINTNGIFIPNQPCPSSVSGITNAGSTYLSHAIEIIDDYIGNENGLCESNEECIYLPNISFDQITGANSSTLSQCQFQNGVGVNDVKNVIMYGY